MAGIYKGKNFGMKIILTPPKFVLKLSVINKNQRKTHVSFYSCTIPIKRCHYRRLSLG
ncbi:hypothetical protein [Moraxella lacunata]|uniref:hypothetical protein n=1 Tax=Moraxella lacunata TaxID=477 RepID=UPI003EDF22CA